MRGTWKPEEYKHLRDTWREVFDRVRSRAGAEGWETPWVDESLPDGNPILSAWSASKRIAFRVLLHRDATCGFEIRSSEFAKGTPYSVTELVLSGSNGQDFRQYVEHHLTEWIALER